MRERVSVYARGCSESQSLSLVLMFTVCVCVSLMGRRMEET